MSAASVVAGAPGSRAPAVEDLVTVDDVSRSYGDTVALDHVSLHVPAGSIVGLVGPSGCGKTTLVRMITGIERPDTGRVTVFGRDPAGFGAAERMRLGYMPQKPVLYPHLSVWANLRFMASMYGLPLRGRRQRMLEVLALVDMVEHRRTSFRDCSGGMQRRVALAATLLHDPELVVLDEPTAGIDPILRERFWEHLRLLRDRGRTIVVPTQYVGEAVSCDQVAVMAAGRVLTVQAPDRLGEYAFGGTPTVLLADRGWWSHAELLRLGEVPGVTGVRPWHDQIVVGVADGVDPGRIVEAAQRAGLPVTGAEPAELTYDEIFVVLVERHAAVAGGRPDIPAPVS